MNPAADIHCDPGRSLIRPVGRGFWLVAAVCALAGCGLAAIPASCAAADESKPESIEQFVARRGRWEQLVGATFRLEGRLGVIGGDRLRFEQCDLDFLLTPGRAALPAGQKYAEVQGTLARQDGKLVFQVSEVRARPSDLDVLRGMKSRIDSSQAAEWYALASWAEGRGAYYHDPDLANAAIELREAGVMTEYRRLKLDDVPGLLELARRAKDLKLGETLGWRFIHEACRIELARLRTETNPDDAVLLDRIRKSLPGSTEPLAAEDLSLRAAYKASPQSMYAEADATLRKKLNRVLYIDVLLSKIERDAASDGRNGDAIADRIERQLPELSELTAGYRQRELDWLSGRVESLTREQLLTLVGRFVARERGEDARRVLKEWLKVQEPVRRAEGAAGISRLADDYSRLLNDEGTSAKLYEEAYGLNPQLSEPVEWLTAHGLKRHNGHWIPAGDVPAAPVDPLEAAIGEGRVVKGMNGEQVQAALGGRPTSVVREASQSKVTELWIYQNQRLVVSLVRGATQGTPRVERVSSMSRP